MNRTTNNEAHQTTQQESRRGSSRGERTRGEAQEGRGPTVDLAKLRNLGRNLSVQLGHQARKRPYVVAGAAGGVGFVAGSLFGSRVGQMVLAAGLGYFAKNLLAGNVGIERLQENLEKLARERTNA